MTKNHLSPSKVSFFILSIIFIILNLTDIILTKYALSSGKLGEANPLLAANLNLLIPAKIVGVFLILIIAYICEKKFKSSGGIIAPVSLMALVVFWNIYQILKVGAI